MNPALKDLSPEDAANFNSMLNRVWNWLKDRELAVYLGRPAPETEKEWQAFYAACDAAGIRPHTR